jgi:hypothetical protein
MQQKKGQHTFVLQLNTKKLKNKISNAMMTKISIGIFTNLSDLRFFLEPAIFDILQNVSFETHFHERRKCIFAQIYSLHGKANIFHPLFTLSSTAKPLRLFTYVSVGGCTDGFPY